MDNVFSPAININFAVFVVIIRGQVVKDLTVQGIGHTGVGVGALIAGQVVKDMEAEVKRRTSLQKK